MQQIDKVIRIPMNSELYYTVVGSETTEWWYSWDDLMCDDNILIFIKNYDIDIMQQLTDNQADYVAIYSDK